MRLAPEETPLVRLLLFCSLPLLLGALFLVRLAPEFVLGVAHCPLRQGTGFPCPTCGGTISLVHLVNGSWIRAVYANPLVVLLTVLYVPVAIYATAATLVPRWRRRLHLPHSASRTARWLVILLVGLNWAWLAWRYVL